MTESEIQQLILLEATKLGHRLFVNRQGRAKYKAKSGEVYTVPYGVGGVGGADLIGWSRLHYERDCVFTAIECKTKTGRPTKEQLQFIEAVKKAGGIGGICRSVDDYRQLVGA